MKKFFTCLRACACMAAFFGVLLVPVCAQASDNDIVVKGVDMTVVEAIRQIEKSTDYTFFYKASDLKAVAARDIDLKGDIHQVLAAMFHGSGVSYVIKGKEIILTSAKEVKAKGTAPQQAKTITVTGVVSDNFGPVAGATVIEKGNTSNGTVTDLDGKFSLKVPEGAIIVVTFIGYTPQELKAQAGVPLQVSLKEDSQALDEVVVVGFGTQKKANLTGSLTSVNMDELKGDRPIVNVSSALQGAVPGLLVSTSSFEPGQSKSFQLRGAYTLGTGGSGSTIAPLVLIDNVEGDIDMLNPEDIENITVLKDAASTAIYGARAAGGVILVTTKRPHKETAFTLNYNNNFAFSSVVNTPRQAPFTTTLRAYQEAFGDTYWTYSSPSVSKWLQYMDEYKRNPSAFNTVGDGIYVDDEGKMYFLNEHDTYGNFMETGFQQTHNISASGGTDKLRYRISGAFLDSDGVLIGDHDSFRRFNVSSFISADITKWFTQEVTMSYASSTRVKPQSGLGSMFSNEFLSIMPEGVMPASVCSTISQDLPFNTPRNQVLNARSTTYKNSNPRIMLKSILKPFKGFEAAFEYTFDKNMYNYHFYSDYIGYVDIQGAPRYNVAQGRDYLEKEHNFTDYNAINVYGTYSFDIANDHRFKVMAGFNQESSYYESLYSIAYGMIVPDVPSLSGGTGTLSSSDSYSEYAIRGGFFRVNYNYQDKYLLEVNGRYDGSSKFPKSNRFGFFPSVSAGWNIAQENFMESTRNVLDLLKLRASYGVIGNQNISNYAFYPTMSTSNLYNGWLINSVEVGAITSLPALVSSSFTWEKVYTMDIGIDVNLFNNRLTGVFDWYQKDTKGMLAPGMPLPAVVGADAPWQNTADMRTRGWELNLNWQDRIGDWGYRLGFNLADSRSEVTKFVSNEDSKLLSVFYRGYELGTLWGYVSDGFYTVDDFVDTQSWALKEGVPSIEGYSPRPGDVKFKNLRDDENSTNRIDDGMGTLDNPGDQVVIGNTTPRYLYGINLGASYKGFDLSVFMQGTGRRDAWIGGNIMFPMAGNGQFAPMYEGLEDYWTPVDLANGDYTAANPNAKYPRIYNQLGNSGSNYRTQTRYLSDASYFRIKNVTLSYTVPKNWISKAALQSLKAFVSIENLATLDHLPAGIDPETLGWAYPTSRVVSFGINFTL